MRLNPKNDFLFKRLFGEEESKHLLISLLNAVLRRDGKKEITSVAIVENTRVSREFESEKESILDIVCEIDHQEMVNVEMQICRFDDMDLRSLFYVGKLMSESLKNGQAYNQLKRAIGINILDHTYIKLEPFHTTFHFYEDEERQFMLTDVLELHFIECPKFRSLPFDISDPLHRWLRFLEQNTPTEQLEELIKVDEIIKEAEARLTYLASDEETRQRYAMREKMLHDRASMLDDARKSGLKQGLKEGIEMASRRIVESMLSEGMDVARISRLTELSQEQISEIKESLGM